VEVLKGEQGEHRITSWGFTGDVYGGEKRYKISVMQRPGTGLNKHGDSRTNIKKDGKITGPNGYLRGGLSMSRDLIREKNKSGEIIPFLALTIRKGRIQGG